MPDEPAKAISGNGSSAIEALDFDAPGSDSTNKLGPQGGPKSQPNLHSDNALVSSATAAYTAARSGTKRPWWHSQLNLMLAVFALLALAAMLFVMLAPSPDVTTAVSTPTAEPERLPDSAAPFSQSQLAEARTKSQDILAELLASKKSLEEKGVEQWAPDRFLAAIELAKKGDEAYKDQDFAAAIGMYEGAVTALNNLFDLLPREISRNLQEAKAALQAGKSALAKEKFSRVTELDEGNLEALSGLDRAGRLDQVLGLVAAAKLQEASFKETNDIADLESALTKLTQAQQLFGEFAPVESSIDRVQTAITDKQFKGAMSDAYQALFANRYSSARAAFARALKIKPGDASAARAMQQALASDQNASIGSLLSAAKRYEGQEEWASAQSNYQTVLQRDPNQVGAKLGTIRSGARLQLDVQLENVLSDTLALSRVEQKQKASNVLKDARAIAKKGPRLLGQISKLETALKLTDANVKVSFLSDSVTQVTLQKVGSKPIQIGQFSQKNLSLKPGRYVATGVRLGYKDVRKDIELVPSNDVQTFSVQCDEALGVSSSGAG